MNRLKIEQRILANGLTNRILAANLRRDLMSRFGEETRASQILAGMTDEQLVAKYVEHKRAPQVRARF